MGGERMENLNFILFISIATPLSMSLFVCKEKIRRFIIFFLTGMTACVLSGELVGVIITESNLSFEYAVTNITPVLEELCKAVPIIFFALVLQPKKQVLLECAFAVGVGFAVQENSYILAMYSSSASVFLAIIRGFGAGILHGACALGIGYGMSFFHTRRKMTLPCTTALLATAVVYHSIYNLLLMAYGPIAAVIVFPAFIGIVISIKKQDFVKKPQKC